VVKEIKEKYGFVYIWRDRKHNRFYIGCHWGKEDDGYICSSRWMRKSFKRRPNDFKRRILSRVYTNRADLVEKEYKWLQLIPKECLGKDYYNHRTHKFNFTEESIEKMRGRPCSAETREKMSKAHSGKKLSEETKEKIIKNRCNIENKIKMRNLVMGVKNPFYGKKLSEEHKEKIRQAQLTRHTESKE